MAEAIRKTEELEATSTMDPLRLKPPRIGVVLLLIAIGVHFLFAKSVGVEPQLPVVRRDTLIWLGFVLMISVWWLFRSRKTAICPTAIAAVFVDRGPFQSLETPCT